MDQQALDESRTLPIGDPLGYALDAYRPKVSAIVSAYYCAEFLQGRLLNLKEQTLLPEIVVVCQRDSLEHLIAGPLADVLLTTPDVPTIYAAWNLGIEASYGEYITNANADDRLAPHALETLSGALDANTGAVAYPDFDAVETLVGGFENAWRTRLFRLAEGGFDELMQVCFVGPMPMWRRSLHDVYGLFDSGMQSAGDYEFWLRIAAAGETLLHCREVLGIYLDRQDSAEHRDPDLTAAETAVARARYSPR